MKKINITSKEIKRIINDLKASDSTFLKLGRYYIDCDVFSENNEKQYIEAYTLLSKIIKKLKKIRRDNKISS